DYAAMRESLESNIICYIFIIISAFTLKTNRLVRPLIKPLCVLCDLSGLTFFPTIDSSTEFLNISQRRMTVSTVGIVEGIKRLALEGLKVNLVLSLHAPNQKIRTKIIPYARKYPLEDIMEAMDEYAHKTKRDITYEYILIAGINNHPDHAHELAHLLHG